MHDVLTVDRHGLTICYFCHVYTQGAMVRIRWGGDVDEKIGFLGYFHIIGCSKAMLRVLGLGPTYN